MLTLSMGVILKSKSKHGFPPSLLREGYGRVRRRNDNTKEFERWELLGYWKKTDYMVWCTFRPLEKIT